MNHPALVRKLGRSAAALGLAAMFGAAFAQTAQAPAVPSPTVMTDTAPLPAQHRDSLGAILLVDSPVMAQREALAPMASPVDTRAMGAGPARAPEGDGVKAPKTKRRAVEAK